ncbi:hypothetical protein SV7mr_30690 [Stieleria bergensis]|uniref:3-keto-disaccharide hydrolase domain-containing protein n=1 Tax=Stieleria bergensis TaxID=2528025 RepID=A0A517SWN3_9BACT|nr:hypothetical protein SV7mr_30690 [Planctomycetes bacterium SV_7m_r]
MRTAIFPSLLVCLGFTVSTFPSGRAQANEYEPELFQSIELIYEEQFDKDAPTPNPEHWVIRQETQWTVKDGVMTGAIATVEYQEKMRAIGDGHDGTRPVIFLKPVPKAFVVQMRVRYNETDKKGRDRGSLLDLGHHVNSFIFGEEQTKLTLQKEMKIFIKGDFFPLNKWNDVTIEIKEGFLLIQVNDRKEVIKDPLVTLKTDSAVQQIDFKGQDFGTVQIDWVKLYKGIE